MDTTGISDNNSDGPGDSTGGPIDTGGPINNGGPINIGGTPDSAGTLDTTSTPDTTGTLDEALERLHASGPERQGWLSNHAPMAVEALVRHGQAPAVHRWLDHYRDRLEDMPPTGTPVTAATWREALGDIGRVADWTGHFGREIAVRPWRDVLAEWWPRLLPGIAGGATHPVIRVGHAVRTLLTTEETAPRRAELAHGLGYWAARYRPLPPLVRLPRASSAAAALAAVPPVSERTGGIEQRLRLLTAFPDWPAEGVPDGTRAAGDGAPEAEGEGVRGGLFGPEAARERLAELVTAAVHRYATHGHGEPIMLVHAATAPNAVLRTLPALPPELWAPSLEAAWAASAAVTAAYAPDDPAPYASTSLAPEEIFARAAAHGDDHTIKFTDTALDVAAFGGTDDGRGGNGWDGNGWDGTALAAAVRAVELNPPAL
ncbi:questin oxidase family protein [Streptomyces sp. NPDC087420]|uniref:questin oxidase family protein n=1 Tax=Streptomyces sp. NPDC087420 TaxID=3365785 RepID=UPI0038346125